MIVKFSNATVDAHTLSLVGAVIEAVNLLLQFISHRSIWGVGNEMTFGPWKTCIGKTLSSKFMN